MAYPVRTELIDGVMWIVFSDGFAGGIEGLSEDDIYRDNEDRISIPSSLAEMHNTIIPADNRRVTVLKRRIIIAIERFETAVLRHRFYWVCKAVTFSSWWGDNFGTVKGQG